MPLTITQARKNLSDLVKRAEYGHEEIVLGSRGKRSAVIVGAEDLADLRRRLQEAQRELAQMRARQAQNGRSTWGIVRESVAQMEEAEPGIHARRFIPGLKLDSDLSYRQRARIGMRGEETPEFRRTAPSPE